MNVSSTRELSRCVLVAGLLAASLIMKTPASAAIVNLKISGALGANEDVVDFKISPDGEWVVYRAGTVTGVDPVIEDLDLFSVPINGGTPTRLNVLLPSGETVEDDYAVSPDSRRVVFRAPQDAPGVVELYSIPIVGPPSAAVKLNAPLATGGDVSGDAYAFLLSPDGGRVVYRADLDSNDVFNLYSVPIDGPASATVRISGRMAGAGVRTDNFWISPDGQWVVYVATQDMQAFELYSTPIAGPGKDAVKLNGLLTAGGGVSSLVGITPDSSRVVYLADQQTNAQNELYSVPIRGPAADGIKLNPVMPPDRDVYDFRISPDGLWVAYMADAGAASNTELYGVSITAPGSGTRISHDLSPDGFLSTSNFLFSPDSRRVVYYAWTDPDNLIAGIYSTPIDGTPSNAIMLNKQLVPGGLVFTDFQVAAESNRLVYRGDQDVDQQFELHSISISGRAGTYLKLNVPLGFGGDVTHLRVSSSGRYVAFRADRVSTFFGNDVFRLWRVPAEGPATDGAVFSGFLAAGGDVSDQFDFTPDGSGLVYIADQDTDNVDELYFSYDKPAAAQWWAGYK